jgi:chaperonin GroES
VAISKKKSKTKTKTKPAKAKTKPTIKTKAVTAKATPAKATSNYQKFISPLNDRLVVTVEKARETTSGGIIIPGSASTLSNRGKVLAVGPGRRTKKGQLRPLDVQAGDEVLFSDHAGTKLDVKGEEVLILREEEVLAIFT